MVLVLIAGSIVYATRTYFMATYWHWRHGAYVSWARYAIPVPSTWYVREIANDHVDVAEAHISRWSRKESWRGFVVAKRPPVQNLEQWRLTYDNKEQKYKPTTFGYNYYHFDDEDVLCIHEEDAGFELRSTDFKEGLFECRSTGNLGIVYLGHKTDAHILGLIISRIRKE
jgi:hypothetical protein